MPRVAYIVIKLLFLLGLFLDWPVNTHATTLSQISKDHAVYIQAQHGDNLSITTERRLGTDPDFIYIYGPDGKLQERLEIFINTTTSVLLNSGTGLYKVLPVNYTFIHDYAITPSRPMVVEPFAHHELIRVDGSADLYFQVAPGSGSMTFHAHSMQASGDITEELYDPSNTLVHTFVLPPNTFQSDYTVIDPAPGMWRCRFVTSSYSPCGAWLEGIPNYFSPTSAAWFEPVFANGTGTILADATIAVSNGARVGVNWWLDPYTTSTYIPEKDAVIDARFDTARLSVLWAYREPSNDNSDPFSINWTGFNFSRHDDILADYYNDIAPVIPGASPVLMFYWDTSVSWQPENPADWTTTQREEFAEFVIATMIHTVAPDLETPPGTGPSYDVEYVELLNEPNLTMGSLKYQEYIEIVKTVGTRLATHPDPRINSLNVVASGIGWVWGQADREMENWIGKLIDQADSVVGGINWHQYEYIRMEECGRFAEDIQMVKDWLKTRGDSVADETILMTETNQHGGSPTCWHRQDTFYAGLWWTGACLSVLRGGVDLIHYYQLVDDPPGSNNYKGLLFNDGPYNPPLFPGGPPHGRKPVYDAAQFINVHRDDVVIQSNCDHPEISHTVTLHSDHTGLTVLAVNLFNRPIQMNIHIKLPADMQDGRYQVIRHWLDESGTGIRKIPSILPTAGNLDLSFPASPATLYAVDLHYSPRAVSIFTPVFIFILSALTAATLLLIGVRS